MNANAVTAVAPPLALAFITFYLGLTLRVADFRAVLGRPPRLLTHLARGDVALSIALTALTSIAAMMATFFRNSPAFQLLDLLERLAPFTSPVRVLQDLRPRLGDAAFEQETSR